MSDIKVGDVVELRSGSPEMTVGRLNAGEKADETWAHCHWFNGHASHSSVFTVKSLKKSGEK